MTALRAVSLRAGYGGREILHGIDLSLDGGTRVALVGPNGSGKTTLLRALSGVLQPWSGAVELGGIPIATLNARARARRIAVVPQTFTTPFAFTVREVVALGRTPYVDAFGRPSRPDREAVQRAMEVTGCVAIAERPLAQLSGGERQRAVVAMALAQGGDVLLLDEPTVHLDPSYQRAMLELLGRMARDEGALVLAVLHDLNLAAAMSDRVIVMREGRVVADGAPAEVITAGTVASAFGPGLAVGRHAGVPFVLPER